MAWIGRVHFQRIENAKGESIRPVLDANLSPNARKVVTDAASVYGWTVPADKHEQTNHKEELEKLAFLWSGTTHWSQVWSQVDGI